MSIREELNNMEVGQSLDDVSTPRIDLDRDGPFAYIDGDIYEGRGNSLVTRHLDLLKMYCMNNDLKLEDLESMPMAYGSYYDNNAIVFHCENCTIDSVKDKLKSSYDKVFYIPDEQADMAELRRVAKDDSYKWLVNKIRTMEVGDKLEDEIFWDDYLCNRIAPILVLGNDVFEGNPGEEHYNILEQYADENGYENWDEFDYLTQIYADLTSDGIFIHSCINISIDDAVKKIREEYPSMKIFDADQPSRNITIRKANKRRK